MTRAAPVALTITAAASWAAAAILTKVALRELTPLDVLGVELFASALVMVLLVAARRGPVLPANWRTFAALGALEPGASGRLCGRPDAHYADTPRQRARDCRGSGLGQPVGGASSSSTASVRESRFHSRVRVRFGAVTGQNRPPDDSTRLLGTDLVRSGDQGMLVRGIGRALVWVFAALSRGLRLLACRVRSR